MQTVLRHNKQYSFWTSECRVATGRSAIWHLIHVVKPASVLMPCLVPEGVIDPFKRAGVPMRFYRLTQHLAPILVGERIDSNTLFVVLNYFGATHLTHPIERLVHSRGGLIFEDCAHLPIWAMQSHMGDFCLWSLNKFLPVVDGAWLTSRRREFDVTCDINNELPPWVMDAYHKHLEENTKLVQATTLPSALWHYGQSSAYYEDYYSYIKEHLDPCAQSRESKCIERSIVDNPIPTPDFARWVMVAPGMQRGDVTKRLREFGIWGSIVGDKWNHIPGSEFKSEQDFINRNILIPNDTNPNTISQLQGEGFLDRDYS